MCCRQGGLRAVAGWCPGERVRCVDEWTERMLTETGHSSAVRLRKLAEASSLLLVLAAALVLLAWALHLPIWPEITPERPAPKVTPAVIALAVGAALWVAMT